VEVALIMAEERIDIRHPRDRVEHISERVEAHRWVEGDREARRAELLLRDDDAMSRRQEHRRRD
jgi:hypothetical protein